MYQPIGMNRYVICYMFDSQTTPKRCIFQFFVDGEKSFAYFVNTASLNPTCFQTNNLLNNFTAYRDV